MNHTTFLIEDAGSTGTAPEGAGSNTRVVELPARFDVHQVDAFLAEVAKDATRLVTTTFDGAKVEMIDMAAVRSLAAVAAEFPDLTIVNPSVALRATIDCTGHHSLSERLTFADAPAFFAQAA